MIYAGLDTNNVKAAPAVPKDSHEAQHVPYRRSDLPATAKLNLGQLVLHYEPPTRRPLLGVLVECERCHQKHLYPVRMAWGTDPENVSRQERRCGNGPNSKPVWIALDPAFEVENNGVLSAALNAVAKWRAGANLKGDEDV